MVILERTDAKNEVKQDIQQAEARLQSVAHDRASLISFSQYLSEISQGIANRDFDAAVSGASQRRSSSNPTPSVVSIRRVMNDVPNLIGPDDRVNNATPSSNSDENLMNRFNNLVQNLNNIEQGIAEQASRVADRGSLFWREYYIQAIRAMHPELTESIKRLPYRDSTIPLFHFVPMYFKPSDLTLTQAMNVMITFDFNEHYKLIKDTLCKYSLQLHGLKACRDEDLQIAVYLFIERHFHFRPEHEHKMKACGKISEKSKTVGVLFEKMETVEQILSIKDVLTGSRYEVTRNYSIQWIAESYDDSWFP